MVVQSWDIQYVFLSYKIDSVTFNRFNKGNCAYIRPRVGVNFKNYSFYPLKVFFKIHALPQTFEIHITSHKIKS